MATRSPNSAPQAHGKPYKIKPLYRTEKQGTPDHDLLKLRAKLLKDPAKNALALIATGEELAAIGTAK